MTRFTVMTDPNPVTLTWHGWLGGWNTFWSKSRPHLRLGTYLRLCNKSVLEIGSFSHRRYLTVRLKNVEIFFDVFYFVHFLQKLSRKLLSLIFCHRWMPRQGKARQGKACLIITTTTTTIIISWVNLKPQILLPMCIFVKGARFSSKKLLFRRIKTSRLSAVPFERE